MEDVDNVDDDAIEEGPDEGPNTPSSSSSGRRRSIPGFRSRGRMMRTGRAGSPYDNSNLRQYADILDERGEPIANMIVPEKIVHQNFFNGEMKWFYA